ncbi:DUF6984 family protein [Uliginosibacterium sp. H1]|uniref:DUF6984 family protein n=1 Tax=Uliginosibacterium sp. H1 TaxID=3114757 RepID=UPI002E16EF6D|nr:hypothetical protein [Uliginosibacterium sp. H1]
MRTLLPRERPLVAFLYREAALTTDLDSVQVEPMCDGGMGSLRIAPFESVRAFDRIAAECHYLDADDVPVSVALNVDSDDVPLELDIWKVDFSPTLSWPERGAIHAGPPIVRASAEQSGQ